MISREKRSAGSDQEKSEEEGIQRRDDFLIRNPAQMLRDIK